MLKVFRKYKYGIVLSGGGARGIAHLGILKAMEERGIFPEIISGVSAGAIVGAFYADGYKPDDLLKLFIDKNFLSFLNLTYPKTGLLKMQGMQTFLEENLRSRTFEALKTKLIITATDYQNGKAIYIEKGELIPWILASSSIPVIFTPMIINKQFYFDGGIVDNLPIKPLMGKCRKIIGSHVNPIGYTNSKHNILSIAERTFHLGANISVMQQVKYLDIFIQPQKLEKYTLFDIAKSKEIFEIGYEEGQRIFKKH
jgi:NTE family protein